LPHVADLRHVKEPYNLPWKSQVIGKISRPFLARCLKAGESNGNKTPKNLPSTQCTRAIPVALTGLWFLPKPAQRLNTTTTTTTNNNNIYIIDQHSTECDSERPRIKFIQ
jgi:hypothetical protein